MDPAEIMARTDLDDLVENSPKPRRILWNVVIDLDDRNRIGETRPDERSERIALLDAIRRPEQILAHRPFGIERLANPVATIAGDAAFVIAVWRRLGDDASREERVARTAPAPE